MRTHQSPLIPLQLQGPVKLLFWGNNVAGISPGCHSLKPHSGEKFSPSRAMWLAGFLSVLLGTIVICQIALVIIFYSSRNVEVSQYLVHPQFLTSSDGGWGGKCLR